jgi:sigma-E factor negative regulatory protein RseA
MSNNESHDADRAALSALMDGDAQAADAACRAWRGDAAARADWHAYHLIGDVLRSDEHRADAAHDAAFVARLRERLAAEPVVLAPQPVPRARRGAMWMAPMAVAAGFVAVAGVLVVTRLSVPGGDAADRSTLAVSPSQSVQPVSVQGLAASAAPAPDNAAMIRSAELDRYLEAHRQVVNASALAVPGGVVRSATVAAPGR